MVGFSRLTKATTASLLSQTMPLMQADYALVKSLAELMSIA
jgi:hypothetical protein